MLTSLVAEGPCCSRCALPIFGQLVGSVMSGTQDSCRSWRYARCLQHPVFRAGGRGSRPPGLRCLVVGCELEQSCATRATHIAHPVSTPRSLLDCRIRMSSALAADHLLLLVCGVASPSRRTPHRAGVAVSRLMMRVEVPAPMLASGRIYGSPSKAGVARRGLMLPHRPPPLSPSQRAQAPHPCGLAGPSDRPLRAAVAVSFPRSRHNRPDTFFQARGVSQGFLSDAPKSDGPPNLDDRRSLPRPNSTLPTKPAGISWSTDLCGVVARQSNGMNLRWPRVSSPSELRVSRPGG